jgi:hypothetical protein
MSTTSPASLHAALVHRLGGAACLLPVPAVHEALLEVGEFAGLPCWSGTADAAESRRLARLLARRGALGLLFTDHPEGTARFATVTLDPIRVVAVPAGADIPLPFRRLARLAAHGDTGALSTALRCADALDVDAAGRRTFAAMRSLLDDAIARLPGRVATESRHAWALLQLTRLLFLRFVESEGWLDGDDDFLAHHFDQCLAHGGDPQRQLLAPLFFGTLNRPVTMRSRLARSFGRIPFLNGGLFEPHPLEKRLAMHLPADFWRGAVEQLVLRTEVTLAHDELDGRITPEMLGRVFEGVMAPDERKRDGTFFTPPALVHTLLREALIPHLARRLARRESDVAGALDAPDPALRAALLNTTVLDPAVGSGAFLVGALDLLHGPGTRDRRIVHRLVTRRLFGVDRNPAAVRLTEMRLWLEVLRATRGASADRVRPLPNLDAAIRAGDALLDPELPALGTRLVQRLRLAQARVAAAHGGEKRARLRALQRAEVAALVDALGEREATLDRAIRDLVLAQRAPTLFGDVAPVRAADRVQLAALHESHRAVRRELRRVASGTASVPFALTTAFAPVLGGRGGFDMVVGNPPWVRAERIPVDTRRALAARYRWWRTTRTGGYAHAPDLSVAFIERGMSLLAPEGTLALLVPAKLATASYATAARTALGRQSTLHVVADLGEDPRAGFDATTYPLALIASKGPAPADHTLRLGLDQAASRHTQSSWATDGPWLLTTPDAHAVARRLADRHESLAARFTPQLGVKTGVNAAFLDPPPELAEWCRAAVRGRDVRAFLVKPRHRLLWPANARGEPWARLPHPVAEYLRPFSDRLRRRSDFREGPWWRLYRVHAATAAHRVVWGDLAPCLEAAVLLEPAAIPLNSCYVLAVPDAGTAHAITAWLNSGPIRAIARLAAEPAAGGAARFGARTVGQVPWVAAALGHEMLQRPLTDLEQAGALDDIVAELLTLDHHERAALAPLAARRR